MTQLLVLIFTLIAGPAFAQAFTTVEWDRNPDVDQVDHYELFVCTIPGCDPLTLGIRYGANVVQPPPTVAKVQMPMPPTPVLGRIGAIAVDGFGNKSAESNVVTFRQTPVAAPKGVLVK